MVSLDKQHSHMTGQLGTRLPLYSLSDSLCDMKAQTQNSTVEVLFFHS